MIHDSFDLDPAYDPDRKLGPGSSPCQILTAILFHTNKNLGKAAALLSVSEEEFIMELKKNDMLIVH